MLRDFGLSRLGLVALNWPKLATIVIIVISLFAISNIPRLEFSGDTVEVLKDGSESYRDYQRLLDSFRDFNKDAIVLVRSSDLGRIENFERLRDIHFEFQLDPHVESVLSIFSLIHFDPESGGWASLVPARFNSEEDLTGFLSFMTNKLPVSRGLIGEDLKSAVIVIYPKASAIEDQTVRDTIGNLRDIAASFADDDTQLSLAGLPSIRADLVQSIIDDQILLGLLGMGICLLVALLVFRHLLPALICVTPALTAALWFLGALGFLGIKLNFLTTVLPVLMMVVIFADSLHLYLKWRRLCASGLKPDEAIRSAIVQIGPACVVASITTAIALTSLMFSDNIGLVQMGGIGAAAICGGFFVVIVVLPIICFWAIRFNLPLGSANGRELTWVAGPAIRFTRRSKSAIALGLVIFGIGLYAHIKIDSHFRLLDYLPSGSEVLETEQFIEERYSGTTPYFAIVEIDKSLGTFAEKNVQRVFAAQDLMKAEFDPNSVYSLVTFGQQLAKSGAGFGDKDLDAIPDYLLSRFLSPGRDAVLITGYARSSSAADGIQATLDRLVNKAAEAGLADHVIFTGYPILVGTVAPALMDRLRAGLMAAVIFSILIVIYVCRSWRIGLSCIVPNLLPIVTVELLLYIFGVPLDLTITVALTVAFGIAVDDSVHLINHYLNEKNRGEEDALLKALMETTPALVATTLVLCAGLSATLLSSLPSVALFGLVVLATLFIALVADIFQLPAYLRILDKPKGAD